MALQWFSAELATGRVFADLPGFTPGDGSPSWTLRRSISNYDTATGTLHLTEDPLRPGFATPQNWQQATQPLGSVIACYDDLVLEDGSQPCPIIYAGIVITRLKDGGKDDVSLSLATAEAYGDRRFVPDVTFTAGTNRSAVAEWIVTNCVNDIPGFPGVPLQVVAVGHDAPLTQDWVMQNTDNATVKARIDQLVGKIGGEYTIEWAWGADQSTIVPTLYIGDRLGTPARANGRTAVTFEIPGAVSRLTQLEDYSTGKGANVVTPYSSGSGASTPYGKTAKAANFAGRPTVEFRWQPVASESPEGLNQYSAPALQILSPGAVVYSFDVSTIDARAGWLLGHHWRLGDDVEARVGTVDLGGSPMLAFPDGLDDVGRVLAVEFNESTYTPTLAVAAPYEDGAQ